MVDSFAYDPTVRRQLRLLINDSGPEFLFQEAEIDDFLAIEGGSLKLAAAQAVDTIADNEALVSKVIRTQDLSTDGAKVAAELRKRAAVLRGQADLEGDSVDGDFGIVAVNGTEVVPELAGRGWPV